MIRREAMSHQVDLIQRENAIFQAQEDGRITISDMLRQLLDLWYYYQQMLKVQP
jgi:hypothetical protein